MKEFLTRAGIVALMIGVAAPAIAAGDDAKVEPIGLYVGVQAGYGSAVFQQNRTSTTGGANSWNSDLGGSGFVGGVFGGYGKTFGSFYLGGEASFEYGDIAANLNDQSGYSRSASLEETFNLSVRPGYLLTPQTLAYGRVGWALGHFKVSQDVSGTPAPSTDSWINGLVAGFGVEQEITKSVAARLDYRHTIYFDEPTNLNTAGTRTDKFSVSTDVATIGILYKF